MMSLNLFPAGKLDVLSLPLAIAFQFEPSYLSAVWDATFGAMVFGNVQYNYVLWTISLELFGSFLVYGFLALFGVSIKTLRATSFVGMLFLMTRENIFSVYYGLFLAGVFISTFKIRYDSSILSKIFAISSLLMGLYLSGYAPNSSSYSWIVNVFVNFQQAYDFKIQWPVFAVSVGAILVVATIFIDYGVLRILSSNAFKFLGKLSFSIYLLHPIVLAIVGPLIYVYVARYSYGAVYTFLITTTLTMVAALPFYLYVDKVAMRFARHLGEFKSDKQAANMSVMSQ
jgi:peptidoglycan/LPS O-acetylase OafA/YrhL